MRNSTAVDICRCDVACRCSLTILPFLPVTDSCRSLIQGIDVSIGEGECNIEEIQRREQEGECASADERGC